MIDTSRDPQTSSTLCSSTYNSCSAGLWYQSLGLYLTSAFSLVRFPPPSRPLKKCLHKKFVSASTSRVLDGQDGGNFCKRLGICDSLKRLLAFPAALEGSLGASDSLESRTGFLCSKLLDRDGLRPLCLEIDRKLSEWSPKATTDRRPLNNGHLAHRTHAWPAALWVSRGFSRGWSRSK